MQRLLVPYTYPHKGGLPDLDQMLFWTQEQEKFYVANKIRYLVKIEIGEMEVKVIFDIQREDLL